MSALHGAFQYMEHLRQNIERIKDKIEVLKDKIEDHLVSFRKLAIIHELPERILPGYDKRTWVVSSDLEKARLCLFLSVVSGIASLALPAYIVSFTFESTSYLLRLVAALIVAFIIAVFAYLTLYAFFKPRPERRGSVRPMIRVSGICALAVVTGSLYFGYLRFLIDYEASDAEIGVILTTIEVALIFAAAALHHAYSYYIWSSHYDQTLAKLNAELKTLEHKLSEDERNLQMLNSRFSAEDKKGEDNDEN